MSILKFNTKLLFASNFALVIWGLANANTAQAFSVDFQKAPDVAKNGTVTADVFDLNAYQIDSIGGQNITLSNGSSTNYSTTIDNVGSIWNPLGINITHSENLGLFQSNCRPSGGNGSATNGGTQYTDACNNAIGGDPDLATGFGNYGSISYDTTPRGNLLILEENAGDGIPDDGGISSNFIEIAFDETVLDSVKLKNVTIVDDASGDIILTFRDSTTETIAFDNDAVFGDPIYSNISNTSEYVGGENAVAVYGGFTEDKDVEKLRIDFDGSGGFGAFAFSEFAGEDIRGTEVPWEFSSSQGILISLGLFGMHHLAKKRIQPCKP